MTSLALIATSDGADGGRTLARGDCAAIHWARQSSEHAVAVCPGNDRIAIEYALAAGIGLVHDLKDLLSVAFDVAYVGTGSAECVGDVLLARWADCGKATLLFDVIGCSEQSHEVRDVTCDAGRGARYHLSVRGPLIMVLSPHVARPAYVSRYRRLAAAPQLSRNRSSEREGAGSLIHSHRWTTVRPRVRTPGGPNEPSAADDRLDSAFSIQAGGSSETTNIIVADPETCARHVLRYLAHHRIVYRAASDDGLEVPDGRHVSSESQSTERKTEPTCVGSLCGFMQRRPRQTDDPPARRARQPRPAGSATQSMGAAPLRGFMERRPRHADDSSARRARQPRPLERP